MDATRHYLSQYWPMIMIFCRHMASLRLANISDTFWAFDNKEGILWRNYVGIFAWHIDIFLCPHPSSFWRLSSHMINLKPIWCLHLIIINSLEIYIEILHVFLNKGHTQPACETCNTLKSEENSKIFAEDTFRKRFVWWKYLNCD